jgi:hypothetical protein
MAKTFTVCTKKKKKKKKEKRKAMSVEADWLIQTSKRWID